MSGEIIQVLMAWWKTPSHILVRVYFQCAKIHLCWQLQVQVSRHFIITADAQDRNIVALHVETISWLWVTKIVVDYRHAYHNFRLWKQPTVLDQACQPQDSRQWLCRRVCSCKTKRTLLLEGLVCMTILTPGLQLCSWQTKELQSMQSGVVIHCQTIVKQ